MSELKDKTKKKIIECARIVFLKLGIVNTSMEDIAKECGMTRRTLYRYFKSKNDITIEVVINFLEASNEKQVYIAKSIKSNGIERLKYFLYTLVDYMLKHGEDIMFIGEFDCLFRDVECFIKDNEMKQRFNNNINRSEDIIIDILQEGINDGSISTNLKSVRLVAYTISNTLWAFGQRIAIRGKQIESEAKIEAIELLYCQIDMYVAALKI